MAFTQWVQGPLVAVATGILLTNVFGDSDSMALGADHLVALPVAGSWSGFLDLFTFPDFTQFGNPQVLVTAATLAVVASLETLLCVEATDKLDPQKRITPTNRELKAQGIGNMVSGLIGGLPVTQVIVRSSANIQSGGRTKASAIIHGVMILGCVVLIPKVLNMIPLASLAAILLVVGYKLAKPSLFKSMFKLGWLEFIPFMLTILGIVFLDLLSGIIIGMVVAVFFILYRNYQKPFFFDPKNYNDGAIHLRLSENVTFLNKGSLSKSLSLIPDGKKVVLDASITNDIHPDILEMITDFEQYASTRDIEVELIGFDEFNKGNILKTFRSSMANSK